MDHLASWGGKTTLDYFGARYFSAAQGRFTTPDWSETPQPVPYADLTDPQTLNLYSYIRNNPLSRTEPDGHGLVDWIRLGTGVKNLAKNPYVQGAGKVFVGAGLVGTPAVGDAPGSAAGALLVANTVIGGTVVVVSGTAQIIARPRRLVAGKELSNLNG
jgi:RHS repeat-associated protein